MMGGMIVAHHLGTTELALWQDFVGKMVLSALDY